MKVGKETVLGLVHAVRAHGTATADPETMRARMARLAERLDRLPGLAARVVQDEAGRAIFRTELTVDPRGAGRDAAGLARELADGTRRSSSATTRRAPGGCSSTPSADRRGGRAHRAPPDRDPRGAA
ncbi:hypothetical protein NKH77_49385 [Streptomyces sp. M19]